MSGAKTVEQDTLPGNTIAVLIPCHNEEATIADVVLQFQTQLPQAEIYVLDNNSSDRTASRAREAGAIVLTEQRQGKGYVVRSMFRQVEADLYIMVDGDGTYPATSVHNLIAPILNHESDMVVGSRLHPQSKSQFKFLNRIGNGLLLWLANSIFKTKLTDLLSGYRAFNRKFVRGIPLFGKGFEIEAELTIKGLERGYKIAEVPVNLVQRPKGSSSKIRLIRDGFIILNTILALFQDYKPLTFFGSVGLLFIIAGLAPGLIVVLEFIHTGLVLRLPSAILAFGLLLSGLLSIMVGLILHTIARRFQELDYNLEVLADDLRDIKNGKERQA